MWLSPSGQVAHTTLDWRLCRTRIFKFHCVSAIANQNSGASSSSSNAHLNSAIISFDACIPLFPLRSLSTYMPFTSLVTSSEYNPYPQVPIYFTPLKGLHFYFQNGVLFSYLLAVPIQNFICYLVIKIFSNSPSSMHIFSNVPILWTYAINLVIHRLHFFFQCCHVFSIWIYFIFIKKF